MKFDNAMFINIPDHLNKSDKHKTKPGSDKDHIHEEEKLMIDKQKHNQIKREHGKTRKEMGK